MHLTSALLLLVSLSAPGDAAPGFHSELIFPPHPKHNHAPSIVECPNGDLLVSWYRGEGEKEADDVAVYGSRLKKGKTQWSDPFVMADFPNFPDCNTVMMIDKAGKLWLFWPTILGNSWDSCLTNFMTSKEYTGDGSPKWDWHGVIYIRPDDFKLDLLSEFAKRRPQKLGDLAEKGQTWTDDYRRQADIKLFQRLGWQPRSKPTVLPSGRILLPLYTDTFHISIMAVSDDGGRTWYASKPIIGIGNIQPTVLRRDDGTLVAYMRDSSPTHRIRISESTDDGITWGPVTESDLLNPGSGVDGVRLANGHWVLVYNDTAQGRASLAISLSDDEGRTWKWTRHLEKHDSGRYHYPAVIQTKDGNIHVVYSVFGVEGKCMKHAVFAEPWIQGGDKQ